MPKIMGATIAEHREVTRARLFDALSTLMSERGFDAISLADIAAEAGIGRTAVYNHFADKESLLIAFIDHETNEYLSLLEVALGATSDPLERLRLYIRRQFQLRTFYHFAPGPALTQVVSPGTVEKLRVHVALVETHLHAILSDAIASGAIPEQDIRTVSRLVHACVTGRAAPDGEPERTRFIETTELFILRALGARTGACARTGA